MISRTVSFTLAAVFFLSLSNEVRAEQSVALTLGPVPVIRINQPVRFTATLTNAWTGAPLAGRLVWGHAGPQFTETQLGYRNTSNQGQVSFEHRFRQLGKQRIIVSVEDKFGYFGTRQTFFVHVQP